MMSNFMLIKVYFWFSVTIIAKHLDKHQDTATSVHVFFPVDVFHNISKNLAITGSVKKFVLLSEVLHHSWGFHPVQSRCMVHMIIDI